MNVEELKSSFRNYLSELYPSEEIQSFFRILSERYLSLSAVEVVLNPEKSISEKEIEAFKKAVHRLQNREPIQYIIGQTEFFGLLFKVNKHVLIPRPETEELIDWIISSHKATYPPGVPTTILDIGTGSGCIAISLAKNIPRAEITALDISAQALKIAKQNTQLNTAQVDFFQTDILETKILPNKYNIIVSNPPYVREMEKSQMQPNVLHFEPAAALYVKNDDPLLFYRAIATLAKNHLMPDGNLFFEINEYLANDLTALLKFLGFQKIEVKNDIFGKNRMLKCHLNEQA